MHAFPKVGIIVLNYNGKRCLLACLESLDRLAYAEKEVIVVDNHSTDDSLQEAEQRFPHFTFIRNDKNEGFAKGMNIGMRVALLQGAAWCWIFNSDAIADPQALSHLIRAAEKNPGAGLLSPVISETKSDCLWFAKGRIDFLRMRTVHILPTTQELAAPAYPSEFLTGCALFIKKELIDAIGFLDERFFLYYEDADYSLRAARAGYTCLVVPLARVRHAEESSRNTQKIYFLVYSGLLFFYKWVSFPLRLYLWVYVTMRRVKNLVDRACGNTKASQEVYRAYRAYFYER